MGAYDHEVRHHRPEGPSALVSSFTTRNVELKSAPLCQARRRVAEDQRQQLRRKPVDRWLSPGPNAEADLGALVHRELQKENHA